MNPKTNATAAAPVNNSSTSNNSNNNSRNDTNCRIYWRSRCVYGIIENKSWSVYIQIWRRMVWSLQKDKKFVDKVSLVLPVNIMYIFSVDVDECFDLYAYLKQKKMVSGIPVMLAYKAGNTTYAPDASVSGTDENELKYFFDTCLKMMA